MSRGKALLTRYSRNTAISIYTDSSHSSHVQGTCITSRDTKSRDTHETFCSAKLYNLIHTFWTHTIYTLITHKCKGELLRENLSQTTWELVIVIPTILYRFVLGIFSFPISPFPYHWEVDSLNTYHTLWECQVIVWCCWEALEEAKDGKCNMELVARFGELDKTRFREALLE